MDLNTCMTVVSKISPADSESVLARLEAYQAAGMSPTDAQRLAGKDLLAEIDQEGAEMRRLVREQHPDLFEAATAPPEPAPVKPRVFSDPDAPRQSRQEKTPRILYRGDSGNGLKIINGLASGKLFVTPREDVALRYAGSDGRVFRFQFKDGAKILVEGSREYAKVTGRKAKVLLRSMRPGENIKTAGDDVVAKATVAGYDAVEFTSMSDLGIAVINRESIEPYVEPPRQSRAEQTDTPAFRKWSSLLGSSGVADLVEAMSDKAVVDRLQRDAKSLANLLERQAGRSQGRGFIDGPSAVVRHMLSVSDNPQVLRAIVGTIPADMVDLLRRKKLPPEALLRDKAMLEDVLAVDRGPNVPLGINEALALVRVVARAATELATDLTGGTLKSDAAVVANTLDSVLGTHARSVTETENFSRWFGDSKVVDDQGKPLVVYHGTASDVDAFDPSRSGRNYGFRTGRKGFFFTSSPETADVYAGQAAWRGGGQNIMPVYLSFQNPLVIKTGKSPDKFFDSTSNNVMARAERGGHDGIIIRGGAEYGRDLYVAIRPEQIKSAIGNSGAFDPANPDIRQSRSFAADMQEQTAWLNERAVAAGYTDIDQMVDNDFSAFMRLAEEWRDDHEMEVAQARAAMFSLPKFGVGSMIVEAIQNRYNRWKQTIDAVKKQGGVLTEANDFYRAEERYHGATSARIEDFDAEVKDFTKALAKDGFSIDDIQLYAYAKHAKERNASLRARREANATTGFDSWSGMTDEEADEILQAAIDEGVDARLAAHHATLMRWTQGTRDIMLDEGLITDEQYLTLNAAYDNYVPLRGQAGKTSTRRGTGSGFNIRGKETERAKGRYSMADNVIEYIIQDRAKTLIRAGKNQVLRSFLQFVIDNPSANLWQINAVERRPVMTTDDHGNQVIEEVNAVIKDETTIGIKDGGREVFVKILDQNLLEQMRNMNVDGVSKLIGAMLMSQRTLGRLYTSLNPVFTVLNGARDVTASTMAMIDETGFMGAGKLLVRVPGSMVEAWRAEFGNASPDYQLFRATGGKTGFMDFKDIDTLAKELQGRVAKAEMSAMDPRIWGPAALSLIEKINAGVENGTRFATFQAARSDGKSTAEAARISKNISVNFNRKGTWTPQLGAWFLFFNPAVQGSVSVASRLKSPKVLATLGAGMTGIAMLALQNASMGDDDDGVAWWDKVPQEVKDRNLIIVLPPTSTAGEAIPGSRNGRYIKIPMPYGWNWFATLANQAVDLWRHGQDKARGVDMATAAKNAASSFMGAYMPVQELSRSFTNPKSLALAAVPDFLNAPAQSLLNVNSFGRTMYPDGQYNEGLPDSSKYFAGQAGTIFQRTAEKLNEATGGNKYKSGALDFTPATIENLARSYGGGPVSFTLDLMNAVYVRQSIERPDLDVRRLPFIKQLYGRIDAETDRAMAYERMDKISEAVEPVKAAKRAKDMVAAKQLAEEGGPMYRLGGALETTRDQLGKMRKQELTIIAGKEPEALKYARLQRLDEQKRQVMQRLNKAFNDAARAPGTPEP